MHVQIECQKVQKKPKLHVIWYIIKIMNAHWLICGSYIAISVDLD